MKFTPKHIEGNVNVSKTHPLAELGWLVGGLVLLAMIFYLSLGVSTDIAVAKIPVSAEVWLGEHFIGRMDALENESLQRLLQPLLDRLPADSPLHEYRFHAQVVESEQINALALPGGHIVVFSGLLEQADAPVSAEITRRMDEIDMGDTWLELFRGDSSMTRLIE